MFSIIQKTNLDHMETIANWKKVFNDFLSCIPYMLFFNYYLNKYEVTI